MSRIRSTGTKPERLVAAALRSLRFKVQTQRADLPGRPDLVIASREIAVFVHGCFWHRHPRCRFAYSPHSNVRKWLTKFRENVARDRRVKRQLKMRGWRVVVVWECETRHPDRIRLTVQRRIYRRP